MNKTSVGKLASIGATVLAAGLFVISLRMPVWHLKMEAPQYQKEEALRVRVYPGHMAGDLREIGVLNHYIGVHIPERLPELRWLPLALLAAGLLGVAGCLVPRAFRSRAVAGTAVLLLLTMLACAGLAQKQMYDIGHKRDSHTALKGIHDFTPPLLGSVKVANFRITASLGAGALLIAAGIALEFGAAFLSRRPAPVRTPTRRPPREVLSRSAAIVPAL